MYDLLEIKTVPHIYRKKNGTAQGKFLITWNEAALNSFDLLKKLTSDSLELFQPDFSIMFKINTDASDRAYGGYIYQEINKKTYIIGFFSKTYTAAQRKYATGEKKNSSAL